MIRRFGLVDEDGAVSADWLALGAGLVGVSLALAAGLGEGVASLGEAAGAALRAAEVSPLGTLGYAD